MHPKLVWEWDAQNRHWFTDYAGHRATLARDGARHFTIIDGGKPFGIVTLPYDDITEAQAAAAGMLYCLSLRISSGDTCHAS